MQTNAVVTLTVAVLLASVADAARAQDWYIVAALGGASTSTDAITLTTGRASVDYAPVQYDARSFSSPLYYTVRFGHEAAVAWRLALEAELTHLKAYADVSRASARTAPGEPLSRVVQAFAMSHGLNLLFGNVVYRAPIGGDLSAARVRIAARAGTGLAIPHAESIVDGSPREGYELGAPAFQLGAGVEAVVARRLLLVADYRWTYASPEVSVAGGRARTTARTHHVNVGAGLRF